VAAKNCAIRLFDEISQGGAEISRELYETPGLTAVLKKEAGFVDAADAIIEITQHKTSVWRLPSEVKIEGIWQVPECSLLPRMRCQSLGMPHLQSSDHQQDQCLHVILGFKEGEFLLWLQKRFALFLFQFEERLEALNSHFPIKTLSHP